MKHRFLFLVIASIALSGIAAGATASVVRFAGPVEVRVKENLSGTDYYRVGRYATIGAALGGIGDASASKPYVIFLPPGVYDLSGSQISMKPYVDIVGSGASNTTITCYCGSLSSTSIADGTSAAIIGADNATLRDLTVSNVGGYYNSVIFNNGTSPVLADLRLEGSSKNAYGIYNSNGAMPILNQVTIDRSATDYFYGISNNASSPTMTGVDIFGVLTGPGNYQLNGIYNTNGSSSAITDATITLSGGSSAYGVYNGASSSISMSDIAISVSDATGNYGVKSEDSSGVTVFNATINASGGSSARGIYSDNSPLSISRATLSATGATTYTYGVQTITTTDEVTLNGVTASASGGNWSAGLLVNCDSVTMTNIVASASGGYAYGVNNTGALSSMSNVTASATGTIQSTGVRNDGGTVAALYSVTASASGGTYSYGIRNDSSSVTLTDVSASASGGTNNYGIYNQGTVSAVTANRSSFSGADYSIYNESAFDLNIGASLLDGAIFKNGGAFVCAESYNGSYAALDADCVSAGSLLPPADGGAAEPPSLPAPPDDGAALPDNGGEPALPLLPPPGE